MLNEQHLHDGQLITSNYCYITNLVFLIFFLGQAATQRDESVTLNIPSLTRMLADSPLTSPSKPSNDKVRYG